MSGSDSDRDGKVTLSEEEWRSKLTPEEFRVTRESGTEAPWSGKLLENKDSGKYTCICCESELFRSTAKFDSGTGWPSFFEAVKHSDEASETDSVETRPDASNGKLRTEVICRKCDAHLGHVYKDGPQPTGLRYCINSVALQFKAE